MCTAQGRCAGNHEDMTEKSSLHTVPPTGWADYPSTASCPAMDLPQLLPHLRNQFAPPWEGGKASVTWFCWIPHAAAFPKKS